MCNIRSQICIWSIVWLISPNQPTFLMKTNVHVRICEFHLVKELTLQKQLLTSHQIYMKKKPCTTLFVLYYSSLAYIPFT